MIPNVPNVEARAAVEIPTDGSAVTACAVVVGISGCNGITYFRLFPMFVTGYFRFVTGTSGRPHPARKMIRTQVISLHHISSLEIF